MDCELCGKPATVKAIIERVELKVCNNCAQHGTNVRPLQQQAAKKKATLIEEKQELIETVRPDVGKLLHQHREKLKLTQEEFAAKLQIRASTYHHYETGILPDIATARKLEHVLKVPLVVHIKINATAPTKHESRGMTMADFFKS